MKMRTFQSNGPDETSLLVAGRQEGGAQVGESRGRNIARGCSYPLLWACVLILLPGCIFAATNDLTSALQRGLFEEEANRNLDAAAEAYQTVSAQFDKDRKLAATAIFRLGEIHRKRGKTNEAVAQYERIVREFPEEKALVTLSQQNLAGLRDAASGDEQVDAEKGVNYVIQPGDTISSIAAAYRARGIDVSVERILASNRGLKANFLRVGQTIYIPINGQEPSSETSARAESANDATIFERLKSLSASERRQVLPSLIPDELLNKLLQQQNEDESLRAQNSVQFSAEHPNMRTLDERIKKRDEQIDQRIKGIIQALEIRVAANSAVAGSSRQDKMIPSAGVATVTDEEEKEIRRIQEIIRNSPDLINAPSRGANGDQTPLCWAARSGWLRVARFLLDANAAIDRRSGGWTPLHFAVSHGHRAMSEFLLERGADVNAVDTVGRTPLHVAAENGFQTVAATLLAGKADIKATTSQKQTPLHLAADKGHAELVKFLIGKGAELDARDSNNRTALSLAAGQGHSDSVAVMLKAKANPNVEDKDGRTPLSFAAGAGHFDSVKALLAAKADPNAGQMALPLHLAIHRASTALIEALLNSNANPNTVARINWGSTSERPGSTSEFFGGGNYPYLSPLFLAIKEAKSAEIVKLLLQYKADPTVEGPKGFALIFDALDQPEILKLLLEAGAKAEVEMKGSTGWTPLHAANSAEAVKVLLEYGAATETRNQDQMTPLLAATNQRNLPKMKALLEGGADVNAKYTFDSTPLHLAVNGRDLESVSLLLAHKADVNARDRNGQTSLDLVKADERSKNLAELLRKHGGLSDLPRMDLILVRRPESNAGGSVFVKGTNNWNRFTLLDALYGKYGDPPRTIPGRSFSDRIQAITTAQNIQPMPFPDLRRIVVVRSGEKPTQAPKRITVDLLLPTGLLDCSRDVPLEFGDVIEIPEREHTLQESPVGLTAEELQQIAKCREGTATLVVRGKQTELAVGPSQRRAVIGQVFNTDEVRRALFSSSDLSRIKVTRRDAATGKTQEWIVDCSAGQNPDLWLRPGDVIHVPDKTL